MSADNNTIVIASAARTPVGSFNGSLASLPAHELGKIAIKAALERAGVQPGDVSEVILGQILTAGQGQGPARQASIAAGIPVDTPAWGMNQICGSGLRAVALGMQQIKTGDAAIVVAGGQESMSQSMHAAHMREGTKMGDVKFVDTMVKDGLWDAFNNYHMGTTAENVAKQWQVTREEQDKFAVASQNKAEAASKAGKFKDEIAPVTIKTKKGETVVDQDEYIKDGVTLEGIAKLRPAFDPKEGSVTAANASGINDGAAAVVLMTAEEAKKRGHHAAGAHRVVGARRRRSLDHGHRAHPGIEEGAREGRLDHQGPRPHRGQRGVRRTGHLGQQGPRLGRRQGQRQRRRHRHRPSDRRLRRSHPDDAALRDEAPQRQEGPRDALHRRRHGRRHVRRARLSDCLSSPCHS